MKTHGIFFLTCGNGQSEVRLFQIPMLPTWKKSIRNWGSYDFFSASCFSDPTSKIDAHKKCHSSVIFRRIVNFLPALESRINALSYGVIRKIYKNRFQYFTWCLMIQWSVKTQGLFFFSCLAIVSLKCDYSRFQRCQHEKNPIGTGGVMIFLARAVFRTQLQKSTRTKNATAPLFFDGLRIFSQRWKVE